MVALGIIGLYMLIGLLSAEYMIYVVVSRPKPVGASEKEYREVMRKIHSRAGRNQARINGALWGVFLLIIVVLSELAYIKYRRKRSQ